MLKSEILKKRILEHYKSIRQFSIEMEIPYSTLVTALERGIDGMAYGTVIRICEKLRINPVDFTALDFETNISHQILEHEVMEKYLKLNDFGKERILEIMSDYSSLPRYSKK